MNLIDETVAWVWRMLGVRWICVNCRAVFPEDHRDTCPKGKASIEFRWR